MTERQTFPVVGMMCAACSANVEKRLRETEGVTDVAVSLPGRTAMVDYDPEKVTPDDLRREVAAAGYELIIDNETDVEDIHRQAFVSLRRRTIVSWLFAVAVMVFSMHWIHLGSHLTNNIVCMVLAATSMILCGRQFYVVAWRQLMHRSANMDTLVALSTGIAFFFSVYLTFTGLNRRFVTVPYRLILFILPFSKCSNYSIYDQ